MRMPLTRARPCFTARPQWSKTSTISVHAFPAS